VPGQPSVPHQPAVTVAGLWHLGVVTAACLADAGLTVLAVDPDPAVITGLEEGEPPVSEPGLDALLDRTRATGRLRFAGPGPAIAGTEIVWIAFDTPVDDDDRADVEWVLERAGAVLEHTAPGTLVIVSSQLPVGSVAALERRMAAVARDDLRFACVPENLRLGQAIETFRAADRFVAGVRSSEDAAELAPILARFSGAVEWMTVESAEMTKHALNAFLATSVAFINEVAVICEGVGADASDVARGLKSDRRIGPGAYLQPGDAFAGGTLGRDIGFLGRLAHRQQLAAEVLTGVAASNASHRNWSRRTLTTVMDRDGGPGLAGREIALWGLTYKPGTDTLRRSSALELCQWLLSAGATVRAYDPAIRSLPSRYAAVELAGSSLAAAERAEALVISTPWPEYRAVAATDVVSAMASPLVLDAGGHLQETLGGDPEIRYLRVGVT
jgi:UDPglucose 6-dehydrogenase